MATEIQQKRFQRFSKDDKSGATISSVNASQLGWTNVGITGVEDYTSKGTSDNPANAGYKFQGWEGQAKDLAGKVLSSWTSYRVPDATTLPYSLISAAENINLSATWSRVPFVITYLSTHTNRQSGTEIKLALDAEDYPRTYVVPLDTEVEEQGIEACDITFPTIPHTGEGTQEALSNGYDITWSPTSLKPYHKTARTSGALGRQEITAQWNLVDYPISYRLNDGTATTLTSTWPQTYNIESDLSTFSTYCKVKKEGYDFTGWTPSTIGGDGKLATDLTAIVTANWTIIGAYKLNAFGGLNLSSGYLSVSYNGIGQRADGNKSGGSPGVQFTGIQYNGDITMSYNVGTPGGYKLDHIELLSGDSSDDSFKSISAWGESDFESGTVTFKMPALPDRNVPATLSAFWRDIEGLITFYPGY